MTYGKIPLIIGLIGHRDLRPNEISGIQSELDATLLNIHSDSINSQKIVLTSLAKGSDRLVLSSNIRSSLRVVAVIPFAIDEYRKDFISDHDLENFENALSGCDEIVILGEHFETKDLADPLIRSRAYSEAAEWMSSCCKVLIAVWDGRYNHKIGGTSETIRQTVLFKTPPYLVHILASNSNSKPVENCECHGHKNLNSMLLTFRTKQDFFNQFISTSSESIFHVFDKAATELRRKYDRKVKSLLFMGLLLVNGISIEQTLGAAPWLVIVGVISIATLVYWFSLRKSKVKETYEEFRVVAETLRIEEWFRSAGMRGSAFENLGIEELVDPWLSEFIMDLKNWEKVTDFSSNTEKYSDIDWKRVVDWLDDQIYYLEGTANKKGAIGRNLFNADRYDRLAKISVLFAVFTFVSSTLLQYFWANVIGVEEQKLLGIVFSAAFSCSAFSLALSQLMGYKEISARYSASLRVLKNGGAQIRLNLAANDIQASQQVIRQIGLESLQETLYWFTVRRTRDVRPL